MLFLFILLLDYCIFLHIFVLQLILLLGGLFQWNKSSKSYSHIKQPCRNVQAPIAVFLIFSTHRMTEKYNKNRKLNQENLWILVYFTSEMTFCTDKIIYSSTQTSHWSTFPFATSVSITETNSTNSPSLEYMPKQKIKNIKHDNYLHHFQFLFTINLVSCI